MSYIYFFHSLQEQVPDFHFFLQKKLEEFSFAQFKWSQFPVLGSSYVIDALLLQTLWFSEIINQDVECRLWSDSAFN